MLLDRMIKRMASISCVLDKEGYDIDIDEEEHIMSFYYKDTEKIFCVFDLDVIDERIKEEGE